MIWRMSNELWNPWKELEQLQSDMERLVGGRIGARDLGDYPAVNLWSDENHAVLTAELPGIVVAALDVSVKNGTLTIKGERRTEPAGEGESFIRQERGSGRFTRSISLPFRVNQDGVKAEYKRGILQVVLPRVDSDKPRRIQVTG